MLEGGAHGLAVGPGGTASKMSGWGVRSGVELGIGASVASTAMAGTKASFGANLQSLIEALGEEGKTPPKPTAEPASAPTEKEQGASAQDTKATLIPALSVSASGRQAVGAAAKPLEPRQNTAEKSVDVTYPAVTGEQIALNTEYQPHASSANTTTDADVAGAVATNNAYAQQMPLEMPSSVTGEARSLELSKSSLMAQKASSGASGDDLEPTDRSVPMSNSGSTTGNESRAAKSGTGLNQPLAAVVIPVTAPGAAATRQNVVPNLATGLLQRSAVDADIPTLNSDDAHEMATSATSTSGASESSNTAHVADEGSKSESARIETAATSANPAKAAGDSLGVERAGNTTAAAKGTANVARVRTANAADAETVRTSSKESSQKRHGTEPSKPSALAAASPDAVVASGMGQVPLPMQTQTLAPIAIDSKIAVATSTLVNSFQSSSEVVGEGTKTGSLNARIGSATVAEKQVATQIDESKGADSQVVTDSAAISSRDADGSPSSVNINGVAKASFGANRISSRESVENPLTLAANRGAKSIAETSVVGEIEAADLGRGQSQGQIANPAAIRMNATSSGGKKTGTPATAEQHSPVAEPRIATDNVKHSASRTATTTDRTPGAAQDRHAAESLRTSGVGAELNAGNSPAIEKTAGAPGGRAPNGLTTGQSANGVAGPQQTVQIVNQGTNQVTNRVVLQGGNQAPSEAGAAAEASTPAAGLVSAVARNSASQKPRTSASVEDRGLVGSGHGGILSVASGQESSLPLLHPAPQAGINSALMRDMNDSDGSGLGRSLASGASDNLPLVTTGHAGDDAFAALDAGTTSTNPTWTHAGTQSAEAGYLDPALGWVGVRADTTSSGLHASVVPGSAEAAQVLSGHLSGLNAYLSENPGQKATVTLAAPENHAGGFQFNQGQGQGSSQHNSGNGNPQVYQGEAVRMQPAESSRGAQASPSAGARDDGSAFNSGDGTHISVMA